MAMRLFTALRHKHREVTYLITSTGLVVAGLGFILGPDRWRTAPAYTVQLRIAPILVWAWIMLVIGGFKIGLMVAYRHDEQRRYMEALRLGAAFGGFITCAWTLALVTAAFAGKLTGFGAVPAWGVWSGVQLAGAAHVDAPPSKA